MNRVFNYFDCFLFQFYVTCNYGDDIKLACELTIGTVPLLETMTGVVAHQPLSSGGLPAPIGFPAAAASAAATPLPPSAPTKPPAYSDLREFNYTESRLLRVWLLRAHGYSEHIFLL